MARPSFASTGKSLLLVTVFGSVMAELVSARKKRQSLEENHLTKMTILQDIHHRLTQKLPVNMDQELKLINNIPGKLYSTEIHGTDYKSNKKNTKPDPSQQIPWYNI